jgi:hypothetical protein
MANPRRCNSGAAAAALLDKAAALARSRHTGQDGIPAGIDPASCCPCCGKRPSLGGNPSRMGLAGNHSFIAAPRSRTAALDLHGRAFLQEYDWRQDPQASQLAAIFGGPLVVAHWINMQYFAAVADPARYGSGNKLLHNVVGGRIGVFEGNSGDLRIGLSMQSVHDGSQWRHAPLRLAACIDAPARLISLALEQQPEVAMLVSAAGCTCTVLPKPAWNTGVTATGWQPDCRMTPEPPHRKHQWNT